MVRPSYLTPEQRLYISNKIKEHKPNISQKSVYTYTSVLVTLLKISHKPLGYFINPNNAKQITDNMFSFRLTDDCASAIKRDEKYIKNPSYGQIFQIVDPTIAKIKSFITALNALTNASEYKNAINVLKEVNSKKGDEAIITKKTQANITGPQLTQKCEELKNQLENFPNAFGPVYEKTYQRYVLLSFARSLQDPRRNLDYTNLVWKFVPPARQNRDRNYFDKNNIYFNRYKGTQKQNNPKPPIVVHMPGDLFAVLQEYKQKVPTTSEFVFHTNEGNQLTSSALTRMYRTIFGKKTGANAVRRLKFRATHNQLQSSISSSGGLLHASKELSNAMKRGGSSILSAHHYIYHDN
jgi:hypothetical protein